MPMLEPRLQQQFFECADLQYQAAESLDRPLGEALQALLGAITAGGKVLVAGTGRAEVLARHMVMLLVDGFERERPPLAACALGGRALDKQLQALGLPGDVLLLIDGGAGDDGLARRALAAAHGKDMTVVALCAAGAGWSDALAETDVAVAIAHERAARVMELQLLMLHALCDALDLQLMGEQDPP